MHYCTEQTSTVSKVSPQVDHKYRTKDIKNQKQSCTDACYRTKPQERKLIILVIRLVLDQGSCVGSLLMALMVPSAMSDPSVDTVDIIYEPKHAQGYSGNITMSRETAM